LAAVQAQAGPSGQVSTQGGTTGSAAASQTSSANQAGQIESQIATAQAELVQLMLASGQTTGLISTSA